MGIRRSGREVAIQLLYGLEYETGSAAQIRARFWGTVDNPSYLEEAHIAADELAEIRVFAELLANGVLEHQDAIDQQIQEASTNWKLERMSSVDRNILRVATFELNHLDEIPTKVSLNEAIEIGKRYGGEDSAAFINGILDRVSNGVEGS